jgi:hypothetical protein
VSLRVRPAQIRNAIEKDDIGYCAFFACAKHFGRELEKSGLGLGGGKGGRSDEQSEVIATEILARFDFGHA